MRMLTRVIAIAIVCSSWTVRGEYPPPGTPSPTATPVVTTTPTPSCSYDVMVELCQTLAELRSHYGPDCLASVPGASAALSSCPAHLLGD